MTIDDAQAPRRPRRGLLARLYLIGLATLVGIILSWFGVHAFVHPLSASIMRWSLYTLREVEAHWSTGTLPEHLDELLRDTGLRLSLYDMRGTLVASNVSPPLAAPSSEEIQRVGASPTLRGSRVFVFSCRRGDALLGFGVAAPTYPPPPPSAVIMDLTIVLSWITVVGLLLSRTLVKPLQRIGSAARQFGRGDMSVRTGVVRPDEIGDVARAFDEMSGRVARLLEVERELLASLSHELRTPLARIRVALDIAAEGDAESARASLRDITEDLAELETLIANIFSATQLDIASKGGDGQLVPLRRVESDVIAMIESAVERQRLQHPERPFRLELAPGVEGGYVDMDAVLVRRAVENILENAHKYSPPEAPVTTAVARDGTGFLIEMSDQGFGIAAGDLDRVFSPFFRADRSRSRATGGVGLGLALAKRVVEAHGGTISLKSRVDVGTTVTFRLPCNGR